MGRFALRIAMGTAACAALSASGLPTPAAADTLLIGNKGEATVSFVDLKSGRECVRLPTGPEPHEIAVSPDGRQAAVVAYGGATIDIIDVGAADLVRRIDLSPAAGPHGIAWLRNGRIAVAAERSRSLELVYPHTGTVRSLPLGQNDTHMLAVSPDQQTVYLANITAGTVSIIRCRAKGPSTTSVHFSAASPMAASGAEKSSCRKAGGDGVLLSGLQRGRFKSI